MILNSRKQKLSRNTQFGFTDRLTSQNIVVSDQRQVSTMQQTMLFSDFTNYNQVANALCGYPLVKMELEI